MKKTILFLLLMSLFVFPVQASEVTHLLGTTGYMIREAMLVGAAKKDPANYHKAVALQSEAKMAFRGTRKGGRNLDEAVNLTEQAYALAKTARDNAKTWPYSSSQNNLKKSIGK